MSSRVICYTTNLPKQIVDIIDTEVNEQYHSKLHESLIGNNILDVDYRNSKVKFITQQHWICGFIMHYVNNANKTNFFYDLTGIDNDHIQYTTYDEGCFYKWHKDADIENYCQIEKESDNPDAKYINYLNSETDSVRKLSFSLLLSEHDEYEGGNLQLLTHNNKPAVIAPRRKGTIVIFDSRIPHRVLKVTKGVRKSIVGWCVGPRWR